MIVVPCTLEKRKQGFSFQLQCCVSFSSCWLLAPQMHTTSYAHGLAHLVQCFIETPESLVLSVALWRVTVVVCRHRVSVCCAHVLCLRTTFRYRLRRPNGWLKRCPPAPFPSRWAGEHHAIVGAMNNKSRYQSSSIFTLGGLWYQESTRRKKVLVVEPYGSYNGGSEVMYWYIDFRSKGVRRKR